LFAGSESEADEHMTLAGAGVAEQHDWCRVLRLPKAPRPPGTLGRPLKHRPEFALNTPATWPKPAHTTVVRLVALRGELRNAHELNVQACGQRTRPTGNLAASRTKDLIQTASRHREADLRVAQRSVDEV
jgi:hypothetical protein